MKNQEILFGRGTKETYEALLKELEDSKNKKVVQPEKNNSTSTKDFSISDNDTFWTLNGVSHRNRSHQVNLLKSLFFSCSNLLTLFKIEVFVILVLSLGYFSSRKRFF